MSLVTPYQVTWDADTRNRLRELGRTGWCWEAIGAEMRITADNARKRWNLHATPTDRAERARNVDLVPRKKPACQPRTDSASVMKDALPIGYEPPLGRPLREFPACSFGDDPGAARDRGTPGRMPASETWALGGSSLAGIT